MFTRRELMTGVMAGLGGCFAASHGPDDRGTGAFFGDNDDRIPSPSGPLRIQAAKEEVIEGDVEGYDAIEWLGDEATLTLEPGASITLHSVDQ